MAGPAQPHHTPLDTGGLTQPPTATLNNCCPACRNVHAHASQKKAPAKKGTKASLSAARATQHSSSHGQDRHGQDRHGHYLCLEHT